MTRPAVPGRLRQAVMVIFVLTGLLGMHGLSSGHGTVGSHSGMSMPTVAAADPATSKASHLAEAAGDASSDAAAAVHALTGATTPVLAYAAPGFPMTGMLLCLAILPGGILLGLVLLVRAGRRVTAHLRARAPAAGTVVSPTRWLMPAPDLVAGLCVSRT